MLKRLSNVLLVLALVAGTTGALTSANVAAGMPMPCNDGTASDMAPISDPATPCKGMMPTCADATGCIIVAALPAAPTSGSVPVVWAAFDYPSLAAMLDGRSIEPELFPPILSA
ncbi:MAG TPA: hypothetical protein VGU20_13825 [Stellaceae bacterium]|nr:hypothetical protein [Stellaceae bacterium]